MPKTLSYEGEGLWKRMQLCYPLLQDLMVVNFSKDGFHTTTIADVTYGSYIHTCLELNKIRQSQFFRNNFWGGSGSCWKSRWMITGLEMLDLLC